MASASTLICKDCEYINESQRIFCHQCGTKLDRSAIIETTEPVETDAEKHKRVRTLLNPEAGIGSTLRRWGQTALKGIVWGAIVAVIIQMVRPPENAPAEAELIPNATSLLQHLEKMNASSQQQIQLFPTPMINQYLKSQVRLKPALGFIKFERVYATTEKGRLGLTLQNSIQGYPLYTGMTYEIAIEQKKLKATPVACQIGRLRLPSIVTPWADRYFSLDANFRTERAALDTMSVITVSPEGVAVASTPRPFNPTSTLSQPPSPPR